MTGVSNSDIFDYLKNTCSAVPDGNGLFGPIPSEIGLLTNLEYLDIDRNKLTGTIPTELGKLVRMIELDLDKNKLVGTIPTEFGLMINARDFDLSKCSEKY